MAKTFQFEDFNEHENPNCLACEEMTLDAADGILSPADQAFFDLHLAGCTTCMEKFAQAQRGAAWLEMLKSPRPEPSQALLDRIISQTSNLPAPLPAAAFEDPAFAPLLPHSANVLPFVPRPAPTSRFARYTRLAMEPRFAMTAAMAFFSIALTLNLTGVRLDQLKAADFRPSSLKRTYYEAKASAVRYSDNLRVVRVLESRVDDLRQSNLDNAAPAGNTGQPAPSPEPKPVQPDQQQPKKDPDAPHGTSRRESPLPTKPLLRASFSFTPDRLRTPASSAVLSSTKEGGLA